MTIPFPAGRPVRLSRMGLLIAALALLAVSATPMYAQDAGKDPVVAKIDGTEIRQSDLAVAEQEAGQIPPMSPDAKKDYLVQFMADMILVTKAAEAKKIGDSADFKRRLEFARKKLMMEDLLQSVAKDSLTDAAMRTVYDDAVTKLPDEQEVHARHILFRSAAGDEKAAKEAENKAKAVVVRLNKGEDFAKEQMVPEFADVAFALDKGKISAPVKSQFGWHVIKVEDKRTKAKPTFEDVKPQIEQYVVRKAQADLITKLREDAKIEKMYTVAPPAAPAMPAPEKK